MCPSVSVIVCIRIRHRLSVSVSVIVCLYPIRHRLSVSVSVIVCLYPYPSSSVRIRHRLYPYPSSSVCIRIRHQAELVKRETFVAVQRPSRPAAPGGASPELQRMAGQVKEVLPRVPLATIITDLSEFTGFSVVLCLVIHQQSAALSGRNCYV